MNDWRSNVVRSNFIEHSNPLANLHIRRDAAERARYGAFMAQHDRSARRIIIGLVIALPVAIVTTAAFTYLYLKGGAQ